MRSREFAVCIPMMQKAFNLPMRRASAAAIRWLVLPVMLVLLSDVAGAITKTIQVQPGVKTQALATWDYSSCSTIIAVGSYTVSIAPTHGTLSYSQLSAPIPGCPSGSPALPAALAYYTWTGGAGATSDFFELDYIVNGAVAAVDDVTVILAGPPADVYKVNYFSNNIPGAPDATVRIDNPGLTYGNLCAMIYVFDADQQMTECCGCVETPNGLRTLSLRSNLTSNPLTGVVSTNGVIKIVSATRGASGCDPTSNVAPTANLRSWATHVGNLVGSSYPITETESSDSNLGTTELTNLQSQCAFIHILGSGQGICSCGTGD